MTDTGLVPNAESRLVDNILHFSRALRKAGVPVGTSQVISAVTAVAEAGFTTRADFFFALRATLVSRPEHLETFSQVFAMFWRDPEFLEKMMRSALPLLQTIEHVEQTPKPAQRRAAEALWERENSSQPPPERELLEVDAKLSWSSSELLQHQDFEQMSGAEMSEALQVLKSFRFPAPKLKSRRFSASPSGSRFDARAMLRRSLRRGGEFDKLLWSWSLGHRDPH